MSALAVSWDVVAALAIVAVAAGWLASRAWRALAKKRGGCACPTSTDEGGCAATSTATFRDAAERAVKRAEREARSP